MTLNLALPIVLSALAMFMLSFLSWMVLRLHKDDWRKLENEDAFLDALRGLRIPPGSYTFPCAPTPAEMGTDEFKKKLEAGPNGVITVFPKISMGANLGLTMVYFLGVSFCLGYLASFGVSPQAGFLAVFRFVATSAVLVLLAAMVQHAIWFRVRIVGHVIEAVVQAATTGLIFATLW